MADYSLDEILNDDPLDLLGEIKAKSKAIGEDERLVTSFEEINSFYEENGIEPRRLSIIGERSLFSRLQAIRGNPKKIDELKPYDRFNLLQEVKIESIDDILEHDAFGLLSDDPEGIFSLKHIPAQRGETDFVAQRKPCRDYVNYEQLFKECQEDLRQSKRKLVKFNEKYFEEGNFFI